MVPDEGGGEEDHVSACTFAVVVNLSPHEVVAELLALQLPP